MEPIKVVATCKVAKKMPTSRVTKNDVDLVTCSVALSAIRMSRETAEQLAGFAVDSWKPLFDDKGYPRQRTCLLFPKRELILDFKVEHTKDSGAVISSLKVPLGAIAGCQFTLDAPDDAGECALMQFTVTWKARGDEVEDVEAMLGRPSHFVGTFKLPPQQDKLFQDSKPSATKEAAAANRNTLDRKSQAAGEKPEKPADLVDRDALHEKALKFVSILDTVSIANVQSHFEIGYNRAARICEQLETDGFLGASMNGIRAVNTASCEKALATIEAPPPPAKPAPAKSKNDPVVGEKFVREAQARAAKNPRREKPKGDSRGGSNKRR